MPEIKPEELDGITKFDSIAARKAEKGVAEIGDQDELNAAASTIDLWEYLEEQRSHVPAAYQKESDIHRLSKKAIMLAKSRNRAEIDEVVGAMLANWSDLGILNLKGNFRYQRDSEAAKEMIEALGVLYYFSDVFGGERLLTKLPCPVPTERRAEELRKEFGDDYAAREKLWIIPGITPQRWLAGLGDVPGELGKLVYDHILENSISMDERIKLLENYLGVTERIYRFLEQGEDFPGQIINNSDRRGFQNTYRGMLVRIARYVEKTKLEIVQMQNTASALASYGLKKTGS